MTKEETSNEEEKCLTMGGLAEMEQLSVELVLEEKEKKDDKGRKPKPGDVDVKPNYKDGSTKVTYQFEEPAAMQAGNGVQIGLKLRLHRAHPGGEKSEGEGKKEEKPRQLLLTDIVASQPKFTAAPVKDKTTNMVHCVVTAGPNGAKSGKSKWNPFSKKADKLFPQAVPVDGLVELGLNVWVLLGCAVNLPLHLEFEVREAKKDDESGDGDGPLTSAFTIAHVLRLESQSDLSKQLAPVAPFEAPARRPRLRFERKAIKGAVLPRDERNQLDKKVSLPMFPVPMEVRVLAAAGLRLPPEKANHSEEMVEKMKGLMELLDEPLSQTNYVDKFSFFLHLNELEQQGFLETYTMDGGVRLVGAPEPVPERLGVGPEPARQVYEVSVPGLAEGRPKIVVGDPIYLTMQRTKRRYEGVVRALSAPATVSIGMSTHFEADYKPNLDTFKVEFGMCRVPVRMQQRALHSASKVMGSLFPEAVKVGRVKKADLPELEWLNAKMGRNPEQQSAVQHIVTGKHHPAPYIIFGPPGTGKTVTLVEAIAQIVNLDKKARVLACATSNAAVDLLANRLAAFLPSDRLMRLNACSRSLYTMDQETSVFGISPASGDHFIIPPAEEMASKSVILSTLCNAGQLATAGFGPDFLTAVFVDEAGQGCEPETLVALGGIAGPKTQIVLAGDPHQLGPVLYSRAAAAAGLAHPLMERLMKDFPAYAKEGAELDGSSRSLEDAAASSYNPALITKLVRNYRSHSALLAVPSSLFYAGELLPSADMSKETLHKWDQLPCPGVPLIVHGIVGAEMRESRSPSYFNPLEMCVVKAYVDRLLGASEHAVKDKHIGIIAPYHQQVRKTKQMLSKELVKYGNMCVGSVEEFQGAERRILILSTVRSSPDSLAELEEEAKKGKGKKGGALGLGGIGFLANPKRFNTAITRAKALLIVIGNPYVLQKDVYWRRLLEYAIEKGAYKGVGFELAPLKDEAAAKRSTASSDEDTTA